MTEWDEDGGPMVYKNLATSSDEEISAYVFTLRVKVRELQNEIRNLTRYAEASVALIEDEP